MLSVIAKGRYATVWFAVERATAKKVAIKVYQKSYLEGRRGKASVKQEIGLLRVLQHKNIVRLVQTISTPV